jgi:hypothetical protein
MCSVYDTQLTSFCTWWPMVLWVYDIMVTNGYFTYKNMPQSTNTITHTEFHLQCTWGLNQPGSGPSSTSQIVQSSTAKSTCSNIPEGISIPLGRSKDCELLPVRQQNVNRSGSNMEFSQTLRVTSLVVLRTSRCSQITLEPSNVLSDSSRAFAGARESTCSCGGTFRMLRDLTQRGVNFWSS